MPEHAAVVLPAPPGTYCQAHSLGNFHLVLTLSGPPEEVNLELGRNTIAKIEETVTQSPEISPKELIELFSQKFADGIACRLMVAKTTGGQLLLSATGQMGAKLLRPGQTINLLFQPSSISGPIRDNDILVLGTEAFWKLVTLPEEKTERADLLTWRDELLAKIEAQQSDTPVAALLVRIHPPAATEEASPTVVPTPTPPAPSAPPPKSLFLRRTDLPAIPSPSRRSLYLALIALITLVSLVAFQLRSRALEERAQTVATLEQQTRKGMNSAEKLAGLDDNLAREILLQTKKDFLSRSEAAFGGDWQNQQSGESQKLQAFLASLDAKLAKVAHIYSLTSLDLFYDFSLLKANPRINSASLNKNEIVVLDAANGSLYSLGTKNKTAAIAGGGESLKREGFVDFIGNNFYVQNGEGIFAAATGTNLRQLFKPSDKWGQIAALKVFAGNIYLLDTANSQIWKYQGTDLEFSEAAPYLKTPSVDFSRASSLAIDGFVYVLSLSGNLARFGGGDIDEIKITGLDSPFREPRGLFTSEDAQNIYILDNGHNRVVILSKNGAYQAQYLLPISPALGPNPLLLADETIKKVFLISDSKVYSFDLR